MLKKLRHPVYSFQTIYEKKHVVNIAKVYALFSDTVKHTSSDIQERSPTTTHGNSAMEVDSTLCNTNICSSVTTVPDSVVCQHSFTTPQPRYQSVTRPGLILGPATSPKFSILQKSPVTRTQVPAPTVNVPTVVRSNIPRPQTNPQLIQKPQPQRFLMRALKSTSPMKLSSPNKGQSGKSSPAMEIVGSAVCKGNLDPKPLQHTQQLVQQHVPQTSAVSQAKCTPPMVKRPQISMPSLLPIHKPSTPRLKPSFLAVPSPVLSMQATSKNG